MGIGDWILATGEAKYWHGLTGCRCVFQDRKSGMVFWEPDVFLNNHKVTKSPREKERVVVIENYPGKRPYLIGADSRRAYWNTDYRAEPGEIFLSTKELQEGEAAQGKIIIVPSVKQLTFSRNKEWPHWKKFVSMAKDLPLVQLAFDKTENLVPTIQTKSFRRALQMLANADMVVTTDGAMHHAAAAMNIPAVVLWGGLITPEILGYDTQVNIWHGTEACGSLHDCKHCHKAMNEITPEEVLDAVLAVRRNQMGETAPDASEGGHREGVPGGHREGFPGDSAAPS